MPNVVYPAGGVLAQAVHEAYALRLRTRRAASNPPMAMTIIVLGSGIAGGVAIESISV
ncbi:MAG: hypothetical protein AAF958_01125 [Planctomycetota bacterium]